jgi:hypothetical protein
VPKEAKQHCQKSQKPKDSQKRGQTALHPTLQIGLPVHPNTTKTSKIRNSPAGSL